MSFIKEIPVKLGKKVYHKKYGYGIVKNINADKELIFVIFNNNIPKCFSIDKLNKEFEIKKIAKKEIEKNHQKITNKEKIKILNFINACTFKDTEFKFEGFYHMTTLRNLIRIAKDKKLYSRNRAKKTDDMLNKNDITRNVLSHTSEQIKTHARFYFRPKTPTYYRFLNSNIDFCLLKFSKDIMFSKEARISIGNAGKNNYQLINIEYEQIKRINFKLIFLRSKRVSDKEEMDLRDSELLIPNYVNLSNVKEYIFRNEKNKIDIYKEFKKRNIKLPRDKFIVDNSKFG